MVRLGHECCLLLLIVSAESDLADGVGPAYFLDCDSLALDGLAGSSMDVLGGKPVIHFNTSGRVLVIACRVIPGALSVPNDDTPFFITHAA